MYEDVIESAIEAEREWRLARVASNEARERLMEACVAAVEAGVSRSELARRLGVPRSMVLRWLGRAD